MENASLVGDAANAERLRDHILNLEQLDGKAFATGLAKK